MKTYQWLLVSVLAFVLGASAMGFSARINAGRNLSIREVPDAVRDTIMAEVLHECFDLEIARDEDDEEFDGIVFEVEFEHGEIEVELEISSTGEVLEKEVAHQEEDDDDEDIEDDDDDDDDDDDV